MWYRLWLGLTWRLRIGWRQLVRFVYVSPTGRGMVVEKIWFHRGRQELRTTRNGRLVPNDEEEEADEPQNPDPSAA